ncbi:MAG: 3-dehydroquinate synthase, partial [Bifidobacteriaceae bacterium]|nr:3-dehydroquinate synthase [Bifidobacteriaceae bacterium]
MATDDLSTIAVAGDAAYKVTIGHGVLLDVGRHLPRDSARIFLVFQPVLRATAGVIAEQATRLGLEAVGFELPDGEAAKTAVVASQAWERLGRSGFTRTDSVLALGGGAATDLGGFVAASWLRGVPLINAPTTLLGMVDAAIGAKTGINTPEGKNLVGAFYPPKAVLCDLDALASLDPVAIASGLAEIIKAGFIADPGILDVVWSAPDRVRHPSGPLLRHAIERAIRVKADVEGADPRESSLRAILNYGHTFAHAVERVEGYRWPHGHAVAVGMVFAAHVAAAIGLADPALRDAHRDVLSLVGLP